MSFSSEASSSENIIVCKCSNSAFFIAFLDFSFSRLDFSRHKSLLVCKKYHSWFYPTLKVTDNKVLLYLFESLSSLQFLDLHFVNGLFQKRNMSVIDLHSVSSIRDTSMKNCDKIFVATKWGENWRKNFEKKNEMGVIAIGASSASSGKCQ